MKISVFLFLTVLSLFLFSCSPYSQSGYEFDPGDTLSPELLESVFSEGTPEPENSNSVTQMKIDDETEVYFTDGGTKYHLYRDCSSLSNSKNIKSCKLFEAADNQKNECCKHCQKRAGIEIPSE